MEIGRTHKFSAPDLDIPPKTAACRPSQGIAGRASARGGNPVQAAYGAAHTTIIHHLPFTSWAAPEVVQYFGQKIKKLNDSYAASGGL